MVNGFVFALVLCFSTASIFADNPTTRGYLIINMTGLLPHSLDGYSFYLADENGHRVLLNRITELPTEVASEQFTQDAYYYGTFHIGAIRGEYYTRTFAPTFFFSFDLPTETPYQFYEDQEPSPSYYRLLYLDNAGNHTYSFVNNAFEVGNSGFLPAALHQFDGSDLRWWTSRWNGYIGGPVVYFPQQPHVEFSHGMGGPQRTLYTTLILPSANTSQSHSEGYSRNPADNSGRGCESQSW
ncbi:hypothetical protein [Endozoicomonas lisbonensis]|uniref:Uncharacterized protein n=1 Tax=Endozoicomonas lisbonensis TaxID=3120522 RepID=A0ABV2SF90_9GAMM